LVGLFKEAVVMTTIAIIHSGTKGNHDNHIKALKRGVALQANAAPTYHTERYANDGNCGPLFDSAINNGADLLIAAGGTACAQAAIAASARRPVIFTSIATAVRPAANMTGICVRTREFDRPRLNLLSEGLPAVRTFGVVYNSRRSDTAGQLQDIRNEAGALNLTLDEKAIDPNSMINTVEKQFDTVFKNWSTANIRGALVAADPIFNNHRDAGKNGLIGVAKKYGIPTMYQWSEFPDNGGLLSYGPNLNVAYFVAGTYAGQVANDAANINLPILSLDGELVINLDVADTLRVKFPSPFLAQADRLIGTGLSPAILPAWLRWIFR
jgi:putative tryptophan/tyrosine transport system substrate-binding protein